MPVITRLAALYQSRGIDLAAGLNPSLFGDYPLAAFTWFIKNGESLTNGLGIALQEIYFLECLFARFRPQRLFVIGNSIGWSTLALALLNPQSRVLAIDAGFDRNADDGILFTNAVAREEGLAVQVVAGKSPEDVAEILRRQSMVPIDFAFIDGLHSVDQVQLDFHAVRAHAASDCLYLFHDVANFALQPGLERIAAASGLTWQLLLGTTSGMGIVFDPAQRPAALDDIAPFAVSPSAMELVREGAWSYRHRHLARWRRSLRKRLAGRAARPPASPLVSPRG
jgi:hypothetical protein